MPRRGLALKRSRWENVQLPVLKQVIYVLLNGAGRYHAGKMVGNFAVLEKVDSGQATDAKLVGHVLGGFDVNSIKAHFALVVIGKALDDSVHDGSFAQPIRCENYQKRFCVPSLQQFVEILLVYCRVCNGFIQILNFLFVDRY